MPSERQEAILEFIRRYQQREIVPPSSRIIQTRFKLKSQTSVMRDLAALAQLNLVQQTADGRWAIGSVGGQIQLFELPVLGEIPAGLPAIREQLDGERIAIAPRVFGIKNPRHDGYFALKVKGDSMIDAHILSGDYVLCEWCEPRIGDIIAALVDETTVTLKRLVRERGRLLLRAANANYEDIKPDRLEAQGVVRGVIRSGIAINP